MIPRRSTPSFFESSTEGSQVIRRTVSKRLNDNAILYESSTTTKTVKKKKARHLTSFNRHKNIALLQWSRNGVKCDNASSGSTDLYLRQLHMGDGVNKKLQNELSGTESTGRSEISTFENASVIDVPFTGDKNKSSKNYALKWVCESNVSMERKKIVKTKSRSIYSLKSKSKKSSLSSYDHSKSYESCHSDKQLKPRHVLAETSLVKLKSYSKLQVKQKHRRSSLNLKPFSLLSHCKNIPTATRNISSKSHHDLYTLRRQSNALKLLESAVVDDQDNSISLSHYLTQDESGSRESEENSSEFNLNSLHNYYLNLSDVHAATQEILRCRSRANKGKPVCRPNSFSLFKNWLTLNDIPQATLSFDFKEAKCQRLSHSNNFEEKTNGQSLRLKNTMRVKPRNNNKSYYHKEMKLEALKTNDSLNHTDFDKYCSNYKDSSKDQPCQISKMELKTVCNTDRWTSHPLRNVLSTLYTSVSSTSKSRDSYTNVSKYIGRNNEITSAYCQVYYEHTGDCDKCAPQSKTMKTRPNVINTFYPFEDENFIVLPMQEESKLEKTKGIFSKFCNFFAGKKGDASAEFRSEPNVKVDTEKNNQKTEIMKTKNKKKNKPPHEEQFLHSKPENIKRPKTNKKDVTPSGEESLQLIKNKQRKKQYKTPPEVEIFQNNQGPFKKLRKKKVDKSLSVEECLQVTTNTQRKKIDKTPPEEENSQNKQGPFKSLKKKKGDKTITEEECLQFIKNTQENKKDSTPSENECLQKKKTLIKMPKKKNKSEIRNDEITSANSHCQVLYNQQKKTVGFNKCVLKEKGDKSPPEKTCSQNKSEFTENRNGGITSANCQCQVFYDQQRNIVGCKKCVQKKKVDKNHSQCQALYNQGGKTVGCNKSIPQSITRQTKPYCINTFCPFEDGNFIGLPYQEESKSKKQKDMFSKFFCIFSSKKDNDQTKNINYSYTCDDPKRFNLLQTEVDTDKMNVKNRVESGVENTQIKQAVIKSPNKKNNDTRHEEECRQNKQKLQGPLKNKKNKKEDKTLSEEKCLQPVKNTQKKKRDRTPPEEEYSQNKQGPFKGQKYKKRDKTEEECLQLIKNTQKTKRGKTPPKEGTHNKQALIRSSKTNLNPEIKINPELKIKVNTDNMKIKDCKETLERAKNKIQVTLSAAELPQKRIKLFNNAKIVKQHVIMALSGEEFPLDKESRSLRCSSCKNIDRRPAFIPGQPINNNWQRNQMHLLIQPQEELKRNKRTKNVKNKCKHVGSRGDAEILGTMKPKFDIEVDTDRMNIKNREEVLRSAMETQIDLNRMKTSPCCCSSSVPKRQKCASCKNIPVKPVLKPDQNRQLLEIQMDSDSNILNQADVMDNINKMKGLTKSTKTNFIRQYFSSVDAKKLKSATQSTVLAKLVKYMLTGRPVCVCKSEVCVRDADMEQLKKEQAAKLAKRIPCVCGSPSCGMVSTLRLIKDYNLSKSEGRKLIKQVKKAQKERRKKLEQERKEKVLKQEQKLKARNMKQLKSFGSIPLVSKKAFSKLSKEQKAALKPIPTITKKELKSYPKEQREAILRRIKRQKKVRKVAIKKEKEVRKIEDKRQKQTETDHAAKEQWEEERRDRKQKQAMKEKILAEKLQRQQEEQEMMEAEKEKRRKEAEQKKIKKKKIMEEIATKIRKRKAKIKHKRMTEKRKRKEKIKKKKLKKKMEKLKRIRKENEKFLKEMSKVTTAEKMKQMKDQAQKEQQRLKRHEFMREEIGRYKDAEDRYIAVETLKDVGKCCYKYTNKFFGFLSHTATNPKITYRKLRRAYLDPEQASKELKKSWSESEVHDIANRIEAKILALDRLQPLGKKLYDKPKKKKIPKRRFKKRKRNRRAPVDFGCSLYMGSLRSKPFFMMYWMCPWFYPHFISLLKVLQQVGDMILFIMAAFVWSPLIIIWEVFRTIMCCSLCTA